MKKTVQKYLQQCFPRGFYLQGVWNIRDFWPVSQFISQTIQDIVIVSMEDE